MGVVDVGLLQVDVIAEGDYAVPDLAGLRTEHGAVTKQQHEVTPIAVGVTFREEPRVAAMWDGNGRHPARVQLRYPR